MSISYSIETAAINIGWWRWKIDHQALKGLFIGGYSLHIVNIWLFFTVLFLTAFFLMECSGYKKTTWKAVFIFLPFTYSWAILQRGPYMSTLVEEIGVVSIFLFLPLILLAFFNHLLFEYEDAKLAKSSSNKKISVLLQEIPLLLMLFMISIVVDIDFFILKKPILLISAMQAIFILLLSVRKIPFYIVFILSLFVLLLGKEKMIIPILPIMVVFAFWCVDKIKLKNMTSKEKEISAKRWCIIKQ
ncbi:MAG: hypothetical protein Q7O04_01615 [Candidatus Omnitrophota bacterium]|nr:hypothetical protein [Candidatus Omnitrophota bacterium]